MYKMACSTTLVQKIILQIINAFYLFVSVIWIAAGIFWVVNVNEVYKKSSSSSTQTSIDLTEELSYIIVLVSTLMAIFSIFGIYNVAKENAGKVKVYGIINVVLLVLSILGLFLCFNVNRIIGVVLSAVAAYLSFQLEHNFKHKSTKTISSI